MLFDRWSHVSRHILIGITIELSIVTGALAGWAGMSVWASLAIALAVIVCGRCLLALLTFAVSGWFNYQNAEPAPLNLRQRAGMLARETFAFIKLFFYYHPFEPLLNTHDPGAGLTAREQTPVLLVHGFYVNAGFWVEYKRFFRSRGFDAVHTMNLDPPFCDIDRFADQLANRITEVCAHSGRQKVTLIAQSMGGLVCRAYLARYGGDHVQKLITLGTPHHGTVLAHLLYGPNIKQMRPGNDWLDKLNNTQKSLSFSNHISVHDNIVVPQDNARFSSADEVEYSELGHVSMAFSRLMMQRVFEELVSEGRKLDKTRQWAQGYDTYNSSR